jgi:hypothetical protein
MKKYLLILLVLAACNFGVKQEELVGKWTYTQYESLNKSVEHQVDLNDQKPYIVFQENGECAIYSSNQLLSKGTFTLDGKIIRYTEVLEGGIQRKIPFLIKELEGNHLVFETMEAEVKRITAQKE